jgi:predicted transcriptional regulator
MTAKTFIKPEDIERVLENGRRMTMYQIMHRLGLSHATTLYRMLPAMLAAGRVFRAREDVDHDSAHTHYVYYTSAPAPVAAPYRDMRLTETMSGYGQELNRFAALCMASRRAI